MLKISSQVTSKSCFT